MASTGGFPVPESNTEGTNNPGAYQCVHCYVQVYAPITVHSGTAPRPSPAQLSSDSEDEQPRRPSSFHTVSSVSTAGFRRVPRRKKSIGKTRKKKSVLAWLIARLQRFRESFSRQAAEPEVPSEDGPVVPQEQQIAIRPAQRSRPRTSSHR
ncbi:hypothetical protein CC86DRAFT_131810 [Ophiobolus disseminans]|uniref:Uncharacterized protein n=1 Tax=Ophiobolus disseminans TaxID=1469910 RepID=A0A6A6ZH50_9PLEO|nr:hypothetical protein CC86DRAFT_131810 [Ophiobolus disseminans]